MLSPVIIGRKSGDSVTKTHKKFDLLGMGVIIAVAITLIIKSIIFVIS